MTSSNYFFDDGTSRKFWSYVLRGKKQTIRHGRIGTKGRETTKTFPLASEIESDFDRYVFRVLRQIERRFVKAEYKTASIPFDPTNRISMWDRRDEFARQIPDVMYQPISGRTKRRS